MRRTSRNANSLIVFDTSWILSLVLGRSAFVLGRSRDRPSPTSFEKGNYRSSLFETLPVGPGLAFTGFLNLSAVSAPEPASRIFLANSAAA